MIRKNSLFFKLISRNTSSKDLFAAFMDAFEPQRETCPCCSSKGNCIIHARYERSIIDFQDGKPVESRLRILRVKCTSCEHTHAILPDFIVPYLSYGIAFILQVLADYFARIMSVAALCERYCIDPRVLYRWIRTFRSHRGLVQRRVDLASVTDSAFITKIRSQPYSSFSMAFTLRTAFSFLQSHQNPLQKTAPYHQAVFDPDYKIS